VQTVRSAVAVTIKDNAVLSDSGTRTGDLSMRRVALLPLLAVALSIPAHGEIYRYTDETGQIHFTQSLDQVPPRFREKAHGSAVTERVAPQPPAAANPRSQPPATAAFGGEGRTLRIPFERYGNLMKVEARLNGRVNAPFLVDTGASGVSLPAKIAERLGIVVTPSTRRIFVQTANGVTQVPLVRIRSVELGGARVENLEATVNSSLSIGLLGGSFFNNFVYGVDAAAGVITLSRNHAIRGGLAKDEWLARFRELREPLQRLERYLLEREISRKGRRAELEQNLADLHARMEDLEIQADRVQVPANWRE
jgi:clan AA aspartic protease (TIGR02281 family)